MRSPPRLALGAAALFAVMTIIVALARPILPIDETRYLTVAWEMWQGGSRIVPHLNGAVYDHKPPLLFWLINLAWALVGTSELAARLVAPAFGVAAVLLTAVLSRRLWPEEPGRAGLAALILATTGVFLAYGTGTMFDTMLATATLLAMLALVAMRRSGDWRPVLALGAALALGAYAKGPVILVHVLPVALLMPLWADRADRPRMGPWLLRVAAAVAVAVALVGIWLVPALVLGGAEYRADVLWRQSAGRVVQAFAHERPVWFFAALLPLYLWPWGWTREGLRALAPRAIAKDEPSRLLAVWVLGAFGAFSLISSKQAHYLIPELPGLALLIAGGGPPALVVRWARPALLLPAFALLAAAAVAAAGVLGELPFNGTVIGPLALALAGAVAAGATLALCRPRRAGLAVAVVAPAFLLVLLAAVGPLLRAGYDPSPLGAALRAREAAGIAITGGTYHGQFNWAGRLDGPVALPQGAEEVAAWAAAHPGGLILSREDLAVPGLLLDGTQQFHGKDYRLYVVAGGTS